MVSQNIHTLNHQAPVFRYYSTQSSGSISPANQLGNFTLPKKAITLFSTILKNSLRFSKVTELIFILNGRSHTKKNVKFSSKMSQIGLKRDQKTRVFCRSDFSSFRLSELNLTSLEVYA